MHTDAPDTEGPEHSVVSLLRKERLTLAVAESLTGGSLSAAIVSIPGASDVFLGGITAYAPAAKVSILNVSAPLIDHGGTVQAEVAEEMARGVRELFGADLALATTGVAGPGPAEGHQPGTVFIGYADALGELSWGEQFAGPRTEVRQQTVHQALQILLTCRAVGSAGKGH